MTYPQASGSDKATQQGISFCAHYCQKNRQHLSIVVDPIHQKELFESFGVLFPVLCAQLAQLGL